MFPRSAEPRGRGSYHHHGPYPSRPEPQHYDSNRQRLPRTNSVRVPGLDQLPPYEWKPPPSTSTTLSSHTQHQANRRKRQLDDHSPPAVKRQCLHSPTHPAVGFPVNRAPPPPHHLNPSVPEALSSFSNSVVNSASAPPLYFSPHRPAAPDASSELQAYASDRLSDQMVKLFEACRQQNVDLERKESCRFQLQAAIRQVYSASRLYLTGSSMNGLGCRSSDADLCLVIRAKSKPDAISVLSQLQRLFQSLSYVERTQLIRAKVPILRFRERGSLLEFDLNVNNTVGIRNTFLLRSYAYADLRIRPLILVVKKWARHNQINDASKGTLSSYALVLMVLHYLQTLKEPVLPSLQRDFPDCFSPFVDLDSVPERSKRIPRYLSTNHSSLGELFLGFLRYYATDFRWDKEVISVREARALPRTSFHEWRNKYLCVEEPFERNNVARAVHEKIKFDAIRVQFTESCQKLHRSEDLNSILPLRAIINRESNWR